MLLSRQIYIFTLCLFSLFFAQTVLANPVVISAAYDAFEDTLAITFDQDMDPTYPPYGIELSTDNGAFGHSPFLNPPILQNDGRTWLIEIDSSSANDIENMINVETALELRMYPCVVHSAPPSSLCNNEIAYADNVHVEYIKPEPKVIAASYDAFTNILTLTYNRDMNPFQPNIFSISTDNDTSNYLNSNALSVDVSQDQRNLNLQLTPVDASTIEGWTNLASNLEVKVLFGLYLSAAPDNLPSQEQTYNDNVSVTYIPEDPQVVAASFDALTEQLSLTFNRNMGTLFYPSTINLSVDNGLSNYGIFNINSFNLSTDNKTFVLQLASGAGATVSSWPNLNQLELELGSGSAVTSDSLYGSLPITYADNVSVTYVELEPTVVSAAYDALENTISITFNRDMDQSYLLGGFMLSTDNGGFTHSPSFLNPPILQNDGRTWLVEFNLSSASTIEGMMNVETALKLYVFSCAVRSMPPSSLCNNELAYSKNQHVDYIQPEPKVIAASYDAFTNILTLTYNRDMDQLQPTNFSISTDNGTSNYLNGNALSVDASQDQRSLNFQLTPVDASTIESWLDVESKLEVQIVFGQYVSDPSVGYPVQEQLYSDNVSVTYVPESPSIISASFDDFTKILSLTFNRDMMPSFSGSLSLSTRNGFYEVVNLPVTSSMVASDGKTLLLQTNPYPFTVGSLEDIDQLEVSLSENSVYSTPEYDGHGNKEVLFSDNVHVEYIAEEPAVVSASYDAFEDTFSITFNRDMDQSYLLGGFMLSTDNGGFTHSPSFLNPPILQNDGRTWLVEFNSSSASTIEGMMNVETALKLYVFYCAVRSMPPSSLCNNELAYSKNQHVDYIQPEPKVIAASYDAFTDTLVLTFNRNMDSIQSPGFSLSTDNGNFEYLDGSALSTTLLPDNRSLAFQVNPADTNIIEGWTNLASNLEVKVLFGLYLSAAPDNLPSQEQTYSDNVSVEVYLIGGDNDGDGTLNQNDAFPGNPLETADTDSDYIGDNTDNCPTVSNSTQNNFDVDTMGDSCDWDDDNDNVPDTVDTDPFNAAVTAELILPLDGIYKGSHLIQNNLSN